MANIFERQPRRRPPMMAPELSTRPDSAYDGYLLRSTDLEQSSEIAPEARLQRQLHSLLAKREQILEWADAERSEKDRAFISKSMEQIISARKRRAEELSSPEGREAVTIAERLLRDTYFGMCIDSRVHRTIAYGLPLGVGSAMHRPAGDMPSDLDIADDGGLVVKEGSPIARAIDTAVYKALARIRRIRRGKFGQNSNLTGDVTLYRAELDRDPGIHGRVHVTEVLDSHLGCAARDAKASNKKKQRNDHGLLEDVLRKTKMALAIRDYPTAEVATIKTIQTSFNPKNGYMYMGLERADVLDEEINRNEGFSPKVLADLAAIDDPDKRGEIISTEKLARNPKVKAIFDAYPIEDHDWDANYLHTLSSFWKNMESMLNQRQDSPLEYDDQGSPIPQTLYGIIRDELVYLGFDQYTPEMDKRIKLLAFNAYNAYNLNKGDKVSDESNPYPNYPYGVHEESIIVLSEGENGPFRGNDHSSFVVFSKAPQDFNNNVSLAMKLILDNRESGTIHDTTGEFEDDKFVYAPVPLNLQVIIREEKTDWEALNSIIEHPKFLPDDWMTMTTEEYRHHIRKLNSQVDMNLFDALNIMREEMRALYTADDIKEGLFDGSLEVLPTFVDKNRDIQAIAPFVFEGRSKSN